MDSFGIRELQRRGGEIVGRVQETGRPALVTRHGKLAAVLVPIDDDSLEEFAFAHVPEFARSLDDAERDLAEGRLLDGDQLIEATEE
ncbi:MAG: type II toxin-antitoxin system Phd/YefM family antitoxin [Thermoleophilaceae bacterium]